MAAGLTALRDQHIRARSGRSLRLGRSRVTQAGTFATTPEGVREFAAGLGPHDEVALEATGNTWAIATVLASRAGRVVVSNPVKTRAIAEAKVKTDKVDAAILAQLLAADFLPPVWMPDAATSALRRQVLRRAHIVRQRTRLKNQVQAILARNLVPRCPASDLFGIKGRHWLAARDLPADEQAAAAALLRQLDFHGEELRLIDAELGQAALGRPEVLRLMTIPGVDATVALSIVAAVGDFSRFRTPERLVSYFGLNPRVRQSGGQPASHGRITKAGAAHARGMLVEAAWSASKAPGPLRAFSPAGAGPPRHAGRRGRHRPQARGLVLAPDDPAGGLRLRAAVAGRSQAAQARAPRRRVTGQGPPGHRRELLAESRPRRRTRSRRPGRGRLPHHGRGLAARPPSAEESDRRSRQQGDATGEARRLRRRGRTCSPCPALRQAVSCARHQPDATAVLAPVKVVRPFGALHLDRGSGHAVSGSCGGAAIRAQTLTSPGARVDIFIRGAQVHPVLAREVVEREQLVSIVGDLRGGLGELAP